MGKLLSDYKDTSKESKTRKTKKSKKNASCGSDSADSFDLEINNIMSGLTTKTCENDEERFLDEFATDAINMAQLSLQVESVRIGTKCVSGNGKRRDIKQEDEK